MRCIYTAMLTLVIGVFLVTGTVNGAAKVESETLVDQAAALVQSFGADPNLEWFRTKVKDAKALLIIPQSLKGAFVIGGSGGSGVLVNQDTASG